MPEGLPPGLRFLKALVILLTLTMIVGVITIVWVIVTRMPQAMQRPPALPDSITLPDGSVRTTTAGATGADIAAAIGPGRKAAGREHPPGTAEGGDGKRG